MTWKVTQGFSRETDCSLSHWSLLVIVVECKDFRHLFFLPEKDLRKGIQMVPDRICLLHDGAKAVCLVDTML